MGNVISVLKKFTNNTALAQVKGKVDRAKPKLARLWGKTQPIFHYGLIPSICAYGLWYDDKFTVNPVELCHLLVGVNPVELYQELSKVVPIAPVAVFATSEAIVLRLFQ